MSTPRVKASRSLVSGSTWIAVSEFVNGAASMASTVVAARVLAPHDFGLMGIVLLMISILEAITHTGFEQALIQKNEDVTEYLNVAFTWHLARGVVIAALMALAAPFIARWYHEPALRELTWACSAYVVFQGASNIGTIFFQRDLDFAKVCLINVLRALMSVAVAIPAILIFRNVWALMVGFVAGALLGTIISYMVHPFRPRLSWDWAKAQKLVTYGKWITGMVIIGFISTQGDDVFVSKYLGPAALGFYQLAYSISNLPATKITHVLSKVSFPAYSRLQDSPDELRDAFRGVMRTTMLVVGPLGAFLWLAVPYVVDLIVGKKWAPIIPLVRILVISGVLRAFAALAGALFRAKNRPDLDFKMNLPRVFLVVALIYPLSAHYGLVGACFVVLIAVSSTLPTWFYGVKRLVGLGPLAVLRVNGLALASTVALAAPMWGLGLALGRGWPAFVAVVVGAAGSWLFLMWLLGQVTTLDFFGELKKLKAAF